MHNLTAHEFLEQKLGKNYRQKIKKRRVYEKWTRIEERVLKQLLEKRSIASIKRKATRIVVEIVSQKLSKN